jgi:hypothetical protein
MSFQLRGKKKFAPGHSDPVPVIIRGIYYCSIRAAARALGVGASTVANALESGNLDGVGLGKSKARAFEYAGKVYKSQAECARAHGIPTNTFNQRLLEGRNPVTGKATPPALDP